MPRTGAGPGAPCPTPMNSCVSGLGTSSCVLGNSGAGSAERAAPADSSSSSAGFGRAYGAVVNCWVTRYGMRSFLIEVN